MSSAYSIDPKLLRGREVVWAPQGPAQMAFLSCPVQECLAHGNRGGGKTDLLLMDFAQYVGRGLGRDWRGVIFRKTYPQLSDVIEKALKWFPRIFPRATYNRSEHTWSFPDGEQLLLRHMQRPEQYWEYHGHSFAFIGWEELTTWPDLGCYKAMMSCLRSTNPKVLKKVRATTNPYGSGHNAVKHHFKLPAMSSRVIAADGDGGQRTSVFIPLEQNRALLDADPGYLDRIKTAARNPAELEAWLSGSWDIVAGGMFDDVWRASVHVLDDFEIPENWRIDRAFDWGSSKPFVVQWWAESDGGDYRGANGRWRSSVRGDLFMVREWYGWNGRPNEGLRLLAADIAKGIVDREVRWGWRSDRACRVDTGIADSAIFTTENGMCIATDMEEPVRLDSGVEYPGVDWLPSDKRPGSRKAGWQIVRQALKHSVPVERGARERPGLFVFRSCEQFLRTFPTLPRDERDPDDVDTDAEDHHADALRYKTAGRGMQVGSSEVVGMY